MQTAWKHKQGGFTLTEMIVVMAIIAVMGSIAIPAFLSMDAMNRNDIKNAAMELQRLLHAARVYAATHRVDTAVVYSLDNFGAANTEVAEPVTDTLTDDFMRVIDAVAVYRKDKSRGIFVPVVDKEGSFIKFPGDMVVYLSRPIGALNYEHYYMGNEGYYRSGDPCTHYIDETWKLGMLPDTFLLDEQDTNGDGNMDLLTTAVLPAHIFNPSGSLQRPKWRTECPSQDPISVEERERITLFIGPSPTAAAEERLYDPYYPELFLADGTSNLQGRIIELFHATGKVKIVED